MATYIKRHIRQRRTMGVWNWNSINHKVKKLSKSLSQVISIDEDAIFKSKDWPYLWTKK